MQKIWKNQEQQKTPRLINNYSKVAGYKVMICKSQSLSYIPATNKWNLKLKTHPFILSLKKWNTLVNLSKEIGTRPMWGNYKTLKKAIKEELINEETFHVHRLEASIYVSSSQYDL